MPSKMVRLLKRFFLGVVVLAVLLVSGVYLTISASVPVIDGQIPQDGLLAAVSVERDMLGVPTIRSTNRLDVAYATGFVHAQDRFFQMDLMRRDAAGELSELVGAGALARDKSSRVHRFRAVAREALARMSEERRVVLQAYAEGVNAGLETLTIWPFEYLVLRTAPERWQAEDSLLVISAMYVLLDDEDASRESTLGLMHDVLPGPVFRFLTQGGTEWDAPIIGQATAPVPVPGAEVYDLREIESGAFETVDDFNPEVAAQSEVAIGSNNWALAGSRTADGHAIVANDMHLGLRLPNTWYRARLVVDDAAWPVDIVGATLPGAPVVVVGSNGQVAWGFTYTYGDWSDLVTVELDPSSPKRYRAQNSFLPFDEHTEIIHVKGGEDEVMSVRSTIWGPIIGDDHRGRPRALRWVAHDPDALNIELIGLERVETLAEAIAVANQSGTPSQNFVAADVQGNIGWTILGRIPRRMNYDSRIPNSWADDAKGWDGWLTPAEYPQVVNPASGAVWTANARVVDGDMLAAIGDGGFPLGARAGQIRDNLLALDGATVEDMLAIQLDDRAVFLERWQELLLEVLNPDAITADPRLAEMRKYVEDWGGRAGVDSVGYRIVREFRMRLHHRVFAALTAECKAADPEFDFSDLRQYEGPLWQLITERPLHLLNPKYGSWDEQLLAAATETLDHLANEYEGPLSERTWGEVNTVRIPHPMTRALPVLAPRLDMTPLALPGDIYMPRVQTPVKGASQRLAVSPGDEAAGYFHMPGGQAGHPLSPFYRAGHMAWASGEPTPLMPGPERHRLTLVPAR